MIISVTFYYAKAKLPLKMFLELILSSFFRKFNIMNEQQRPFYSLTRSDICNQYIFIHIFFYFFLIKIRPQPLEKVLLLQITTPSQQKIARIIIIKSQSQVQPTMRCYYTSKLLEVSMYFCLSFILVFACSTGKYDLMEQQTRMSSCPEIIQVMKMSMCFFLWNRHPRLEFYDSNISVC